MKYNLPLLFNNNFNIFQNIDSTLSIPKPPLFPQNPNNFFKIFPFQNVGIWNTYQKLYSQIISQDKTDLNSLQNDKQNIIEYKPSFNKIQVILKEDLNNIQNEANKTFDTEKKLITDDNVLGKKRKKKVIYKVEKMTDKNNESFSKNKIRGRKKKYEIIKGNHTKFTEDNIMRKIKCHFFIHINKTLNQSLIDKKNYFYRLDNYINENLKKDYNIKLMNLTLKEIYSTTNISHKYKKYENDINKKLIEKIYSEKNENEVMKILDKSYIETFNSLMENNIDNFCNEILKKDEKNGLAKMDINNYFNEIKNLCLNYENWFQNKRGRKEKNNKNVSTNTKES